MICMSEKLVMKYYSLLLLYYHHYHSNLIKTKNVASYQTSFIISHRRAQDTSFANMEKVTICSDYEPFERSFDAGESGNVCGSPWLANNYDHKERKTKFKSIKVI